MTAEDLRTAASLAALLVAVAVPFLAARRGEVRDLREEMASAKRTLFERLDRVKDELARTREEYVPRAELRELRSRLEAIDLYLRELAGGLRRRSDGGRGTED
jgi:hypothetical protein